ncbi:hypothetical protein FXV77_10420 [Sphingobacterium phlebotomi]|uniref:Prepilin-type N-terminal cleavage/methylation domain-containing protein n=1 Tax=Sphingobacterium phlebotomi TaxID=2605433 RepID=A0A5D4H7S2_9SPHI|nr:hypothetical protein [Sphingobacterium phlebotomi]TYR36313.1 hypothetical protein FXV77_10420 [Sphingobacterium phlebotomi]
MVKLSRYQTLSFRASTLVEVLIALIILLAVFAAGMVLFTRLVNASTSKRQTTVRLELKQLGNAYLAGDSDNQGTKITHVAAYNVEEEMLAPYTDRKRVRFYAYDIENNSLLDSLILILPLDDDQDTL